MRIFLIDAHALCYRSFYAIKGLATSKGQATNAVFGFVSTFKKILKDFQPEYMAACFDYPARTFRQERFAEYKINRPVMPAGLISQMPLIKRIVAAYNVPVLEAEGFEADDIIATMTRRFSGAGQEVVIVSDDKDMYQLVNDQVKVYSSRKGAILTATEVKEHLGIEPQFVPDFMALAGDQIDNIPGVAGLGKVTARDLVARFGHLEDILAHADEIRPARVKEKLITQKEQAILSKELAVLKTEVPLDVGQEALRVRPPDTAQLMELFTELELNRFAADLGGQPAEKGDVAITEIGSPEAAGPVLAAIKKQAALAFFMEMPGPQLSLTAGELFISAGGPAVHRVKKEKIALFKEALADPGIVKVTCDLKEMMKGLGEMGFSVAGPAFDVEIAAYLLSPGRTAFDLKTLAWQHLKLLMPEKESPAQAAEVIFRLYSPLKEELARRELRKLFDEIEMPLTYVLFRMEREGVTIDCELLAELSRKCEKRLNAIVKDLFNLAGEEFNLNSPKQLGRILFEKLKLPTVKRTKTGFSTNEEVLTILAGQHPLPAMVLEYRQLAKLKSTYIDSLPKLVDPSTGRVHASFNQTGAETGRLSSNRPNLQNIPVRTELGRMIRKAFIPSAKDRLIVAADYSQIELRILAHLSQDDNLKAAFHRDEDIHAFTAGQIFDVAPEAVTPAMRDSAKRVNFGIIYGMSAFGLAKDLNISQGEAEGFIDRYFLRYPKVRAFMDREINRCENLGYVTTLLNRRRYIPDIHNDDQAIRQFAQRQAINTPVQGSAADLIKLAMLRIQEELDRRRLASRMIITVHDELVFDVPKKEMEELVGLGRERMENALKLDVPVKVKVEAGKNWLEMEKI